MQTTPLKIYTQFAASWMSARSLSVSAPADNPPWRLMPLWSDNSPPTATSVTMRGPETLYVEYDLAVIDSSVAGMNVVRQRLVCNSTDLAVPSWLCETSNVNSSPSVKFTLPAQSVQCEFWALQITRHTTHLHCRRSIAHALNTLGVIIGITMREIDAHCVDAGAIISASTLGVSEAGPVSLGF